MRDYEAEESVTPEGADMLARIDRVAHDLSQIRRDAGIERGHERYDSHIGALNHLVHAWRHVARATRR